MKANPSTILVLTRKTAAFQMMIDPMVLTEMMLAEMIVMEMMAAERCAKTILTVMPEVGRIVASSEMNACQRILLFTSRVVQSLIPGLPCSMHGSFAEHVNAGSLSELVFHMANTIAILSGMTSILNTAQLENEFFVPVGPGTITKQELGAVTRKEMLIVREIQNHAATNASRGITVNN
jgi:hypothetical protein